MAWTINQDRNTGGWYVTDTNTGEQYYAGDPGAAISDAIREGGMPASLRALLLSQAQAIIDQQNAALARASAGDIVGNANLARDEGANATRPIHGQEILTPTGRIDPAGGAAGTNANPTPTTENTPTDGTDPPVKTISQTQAINNQQASIRAIDNAIAATGGPGAGAPPDDQRGGNNPSANTSNAVRNRLDELYGGAGNGIVSQDNILDRYASYTYSLSWYLMNPQTYNQTIKSTKKDLNGYYLLAQSGGAPIATGVINPGESGPDAGTAGRNPYFNLDYYIDNLTIGSKLSGGTTAGGSATTTELSFTVTEPNGISLIPNLRAACQDLYATTGQIGALKTPNYSAATYCMVIRFYGYDDAGNLVAPIATTTPATDRTAAVEKFVFFMITDVKFSVGNRLVEYKITGKTESTGTGFSSNRGQIPAQFNFTGTTVKDILVGAVVQQTASEAAGDKTRGKNPIKPDPPVKVGALPIPQQAAIAAGTDPNAVNPQGMAFGGGGL
jgi:hypothetical protein